MLVTSAAKRPDGGLARGLFVLRRVADSLRHRGQTVTCASLKNVGANSKRSNAASRSIAKISAAF